MGKALSEMTLEELWELFPIILQDHNPAYKEWYSAEKEEIIKAIEQKDIIRINHIGSSVVEGLVAKPTIDILLEVVKKCDIENLKSKLKKAGWTLMSFRSEPDFKMSLNKGYTPQGFAEKVYHLHVRFPGDWDELYFRDYLIMHPEVAKEYGELKRKLMKQYEHNRDGYTEAKTEFVAKWSKAAKEEFGGRYAL
jgi:GrpB-like predicted nucleotidyltransferase (UPF0157 family)